MRDGDRLAREGARAVRALALGTALGLMLALAAGSRGRTRVP